MTAAIGRLIRKIHRQDANWTRTPPTNGPIAAAMDPSPDQAPIAFARSSWWKTPWIMDRLPGVSSAAPMPCRIRATISTSGVGAMPHNSEAAANQTVPTTKIRRRPNRSPSDPPSRISAARESR